MPDTQIHDTQRKAAELHDAPAHAHEVAEQHGKQDHLTGHEQSRQAHEHAHDMHGHSETNTNGHGIATFIHADIEALAHQLWQARGCPEGSPEEDWFHAAEQLRSRSARR